MTAENIAVIEARRAELECRQGDELAAAQARGAELQALKLTLQAKAGTKGKLFGSLGTIDIAEACSAAGVPLERSEVRLPDGPIRALGEFEIEIHLHADVNVPLRIEVLPEGDLVPEAEVLALLDPDAAAEASESDGTEDGAGD